RFRGERHFRTAAVCAPAGRAQAREGALGVPEALAVPYPAGAPNTISTNRMNVITWTLGHHRQIARMGNISAESRESTNRRPTTHPPGAGRGGGRATRHAQGELTTARKTKKASPSTATGMPNTIDCALVVTFSQLIVLLAGQARVTDEL